MGVLAGTLTSCSTGIPAGPQDLGVSSSLEKEDNGNGEKVTETILPPPGYSFL